MSLSDDLQKEIAEIFAAQWSKREGQVVPEPKDIALKNDAVELDATVLYADLSKSTALVDSSKAHFAAEVYKAYLHGAAKVIKSENGVITAYDGDRVMAVFIGDSKNTSAVRCALKINYVVKKIINPALKKQYLSSTYEVQQTIGVDTSKLFVARTGVRGDNDLVWVGRAANYAAKLCDLPPEYPSWITKAVYDCMAKDVKTSSDGKAMWEAMTWTSMNKMAIYRSNWTWLV